MKYMWFLYYKYIYIHTHTLDILLQAACPDPL